MSQSVFGMNNEFANSEYRVLPQTAGNDAYFLNGALDLYV
jgi:hypothetical protein